jgi:DNA-binding transcriptional ArsR family regulator
MVLRIYFTADDVARTRVASHSDPLWEVLLSDLRLRSPARLLELRAWFHRIRTDPAKAARMRPGAQMLSILAPWGPYIPDFLTPDEAKHGLDAGLEAVLSTPRRRLRHELGRLAEHAPLPDWIRPMAEGDPTALTRLAEGLRAYHNVVIAPHGDLIKTSVDADRARRAHSLLDNGTEGLFGSMRHLARWCSPVLEVDYPVDQELHLRGRGLRLVPSFFCDRFPVSLADPDLAPVLLYPIDQDCRWTQAISAGEQRPLDSLMGPTRAAALRALDVDLGTSTTQLARRLGTSPASASRHATVLRNAGLITTHRDGTAVLHMPTPLGVALLEHDNRR